jgi:hypothetical protein
MCSKNAIRLRFMKYFLEMTILFAEIIDMGSVIMRGVGGHRGL